ncbi:MAG: hypothetical protein LC772_06680 [Chloroflexi bacterium]|nr:hypothetical protein [Chloroflexota bacterium]
MAISGQSKSRYLEQAILNAVLRNTPFTSPAAVYYGLYTTPVWAPSTAYALNALVIPTATNGHIYKVTTAGTSAATQPTWPTTAGGTVADGTVVWTEQTLALETNALGAEVTGNAYARQAVAFSAPTGGAQESSTVTQTAASVTFPTATAAWGSIGGFGIFDASTAGNLLYYGIFNTSAAAKIVGAGDSFSMTNATTVTED